MYVCMYMDLLMYLCTYACSHMNFQVNLSCQRKSVDLVLNYALAQRYIALIQAMKVQQPEAILCKLKAKVIFRICFLFPHLSISLSSFNQGGLGNKEIFQLNYYENEDIMVSFCCRFILMYIVHIYSYLLPIQNLFFSSVQGGSLTENFIGEAHECQRTSGSRQKLIK